MANTPLPPSEQVASVGIDVVTNADGATASLKGTLEQAKLLTATVGDLDKAIESNTAWIEKSKNKWQQLVDQVAAVAQAEKDAQRIIEANSVAAQNLIGKIKDLTEIYGMNNEQLLRHRSVQADVIDQTEKYISELERLKRVDEEVAIGQRRDIELNNIRNKQYSEEVALIQKRDLELHEMRTKEAAEIDAWYAKQFAIVEASVAKQIAIQEKRDLEMHNLRTKEAAEFEAAQARQVEIAENAARKRIEIEQRRDVELYNMRTKEAEDQIRLNERAAMEDIRYAQMSTKGKIAELEKLKLYQADSRLSGAIGDNFSGAAIADIGSLRAYKAEIDALPKSHRAAAESADGLSISFANNRAKTEALVIAHEALQGRYTRIPGSLMVLAEYTNAASLAMTGMGIATLAVLGSIVGLGLGIIKGIAEQKAMQDALILTGNYAGTTAEELNTMAHAAVTSGGSILEAKKAVTELAASGRFTGEQIASVSKSVIELEHATGQSIDKTIKAFESLAVEATGYTDRMSSAVSKNLVKLNDQYHFLTESVYEQIRSLEREGKQREASALAMKSFSDAVEAMSASSVANLGYVERAWRSVKGAVLDAVDAVEQWGKKQGPAQRVAELAAEQAKLNMQVSTGIAGGAAAEVAKVKLVQVNKDLTAASKELLAINERAYEQGERAQSQSNAIHAAQELILKDQKNKKGNVSELELAKQKDKELEQTVREGNPNSDLITDDAIAKRLAATIKDFTARVGAVKDGHRQILGAQEDAEKAAYQLSMDAAQKEIAEIKRNVKAGITEQKEGYDQIAVLRQVELTAIDKQAKDKIATLEKYRAAHEKEYAAISRAIQKATLDAELQKQKVNEAMGGDRTDVAVAAAKEQEKAMKLIETSGQAEIKALDQKIIKQKEFNAEIGKSKEQIEFARKAQELSLTNQLQGEADLITASINAGVIEGNLLQQQLLRLDVVNQLILRRKELAAIHDDGAALAAASPTELGKNADLAAQQWKKAGEEIGKSLSNAFGTAGKAAGDMFKVFAIAQSKEIELKKQLDKTNAEAVDTDASRKKVAEALTTYQAESARNQVASYGNMADAASGFFDKQSNGYKALQTMSQIFHAAELAMTIAELVPKGISAVLSQGSGDPYTAFGRMAAMAAIVAGLGVAIGGTGGGVNANASAERQAAAGTGSVFGDSSAKSASIANSLSIIERNSSLGLVHSQDMVNSLRQLVSGIQGFTNLVLRTDGLNGKVSGLGDQGVGIIGKLFFPTAGLLSKIPVLGGIIDNLMQKAFGSTKTLQDQGLTFGYSTQGGVQASGYNDVETKKKAFFFTYSDSVSREQSSLSPEITNQFSQVAKALADGTKQAAQALGVGTADINARLATFSSSVQDISFKGLTGDQIQKQFEAIFSKLGDDMAKVALPGLDQFQKVGEGYFETLNRITNDYQQVSDVLAVLGKTSTQAFGTVGLASIRAREDLIAAAGGIDKLASGTKFFVDNFLTKAEQMGPRIGAVNDELARLGLSSIKTMDQFKAAVEGANLGTAQGQKLYTSLLNLAPAFKDVNDYTTALANGTVQLTQAEQAALDMQKKKRDLDIQLLDAMGKTAEATAARRADELAALAKLNPALAQTQKNIYDVTDAANSVAKARADLTTAYQAESTAMQGTIDKFRSFSNTLQTFRDSQLLGAASPLTPEQKYAESKAQFDRTLDLAKGGDATAQSGLTAAATAFLNASKVSNASNANYTSDFNLVQSALSSLALDAKAKADVAQISLDTLKAQVNRLTDINNSVMSTTTAIYNLSAALGVQVTTNARIGSQVNQPLVSQQTNPLQGPADIQPKFIEPLIRVVGQVQQEVANLRADQSAQTGAVVHATYDANNRNAATISSAVDNSSGRASFESIIKGVIR